MKEFVAERSNAVRFDKYMNEHLFGKGGFYTEQVVIGENGHFTTYAERPAFAFFIYLSLKNQYLAGKQFLEVGGGSGAFKKNYLQFSPETEYISVDASVRLLAEQEKLGGTAHFGRAEKLPLEDESLDGVIFGNEVMDMLPCRVFKIRNLGGKISVEEEGFVTGKNGQFSLKYMNAERDEFILLYESFLKESAFDVRDGVISSVSPITPLVISEIGRVLKKGKGLLFDYGYWSGPEARKIRYSDELPYYMENCRYHSVKDILEGPYEVDITYYGDFDFFKWVAVKTGLFSAVNVAYIEEFCNEIWNKGISVGDFNKAEKLDVITDIETFLNSTKIVLELEKK